MPELRVPDQFYRFLEQNAHRTVGELLGIPLTSKVVSLKSTTARKRQAKTDIHDLKLAGLLSQGQIVFLHDYQGRRLPGVQAEVGPLNKLMYRGKRYSMSRLAAQLLEDHGFTSEAVRGPAHWFTEAGESLRSVWERHNRTARTRSA